MIEYRKLQPRDYDRIMSVWNEAGLSHRPEGRDSRENVTSEMMERPDFFIGAFDGGELIGTVLGTFDGRRGCVNRLAVVSGYRRSGVAQRLINLCEDELRKAGAKVIFCLIEERNLPSLALFQKMGYELHKNIHYLSKRDHPKS